jgi:phosphonate transport system substrate-binding protein
VDPSKVARSSTTPPYFDYNWTVCTPTCQLPSVKADQGLLALSPATAEGKGSVVGAAARDLGFVPSNSLNYKGIEVSWSQRWPTEVVRNVQPSGSL